MDSRRFYRRLREALYASQLTPDEVRSLDPRWWPLDVADRFAWAAEFDGLPWPDWRAAVVEAFEETHASVADCQGLLAFIDEHRSAVAYDLLNLGLRLRDFPSPDLTYGDMLVIIQQAPRESAIAKAVDPERAEWSLTDYLLAQVVDANTWLVWSKSKDGQKNRNRPKPIPRPGLEDENSDVQHFGSDPVPIDELEHFLGWSAEMAGDAPLADPPQPRDARGRFMRNP